VSGAVRALRVLIAGLVSEATRARDDWTLDALLAQDPTALDELAANGSTVISVDGRSLSYFLRAARAEGMHVATHNDGNKRYCVLISRRPIRSVAGAVRLLQHACSEIGMTKSVSHRTLSIRF